MNTVLRCLALFLVWSKGTPALAQASTSIALDEANAKGEFYNSIRFPEFAEEIKDYLSTLGPTYPKDIEQLIARATEFKAPRPDGATPNPARWTLFKRESESGKLD